MRKLVSGTIAGTVATALLLGALPVFACDGETKASSMNGSCTSSEKASLSTTCAAKSAMTSLLKEAPGTRFSYERVDGGVALIVTAASAKYVPTVQNAVSTRLVEMQTMTASNVPAKGASCCMSATKATKVSDTAKTCPVTGASASTEGSHCAMSTTSASVTCTHDGATQASMTECPDWMKVLCTANCHVENTKTGVRVVWTTADKTQVGSLQAAGEKFHADLSQL